MFYAISDIHGHFGEFMELLKKINFKKEDELYILGDAVDRGPEPMKCLQYIMEHDNIHMLIGNHELMMYEALQLHYSWSLKDWYNNGGKITRAKFEELAGPEQEDILNFIKELPINIEVSANGINYILCHAAPLLKHYGIDFDDTSLIIEYSNEKEFCAWCRDLVNPIENKTIIMGHTPTFHYQNLDKAEICHFDNTRINIDCGAAYPQYGGRLCCFCLDTQEVWYQDIKK